MNEIIQQIVGNKVATSSEEQTFSCWPLGDQSLKLDGTKSFHHKTAISAVLHNKGRINPPPRCQISAPGFVVDGFWALFDANHKTSFHWPTRTRCSYRVPFQPWVDNRGWMPATASKCCVIWGWCYIYTVPVYDVQMVSTILLNKAQPVPPHCSVWWWWWW